MPRPDVIRSKKKHSDNNMRHTRSKRTTLKSKNARAQHRGRLLKRAEDVITQYIIEDKGKESNHPKFNYKTRSSSILQKSMYYVCT